MKRWVLWVLAFAAGFVFAVSASGQTPPKKGGATGEVKSKFYDFSDQVIDGEIKRPSTLYTDARQRVKFDRLLRLKKSFLDQMLQTAKEQVFK